MYFLASRGVEIQRALREQIDISPQQQNNVQHIVDIQCVEYNEGVDGR